MQDKFSKKIEDALQSIDNIEKAHAPFFFFTRLEARMKNDSNVWEKITSFLAKPMMTIACVCLVIMINAFVIFSSSNAKNTSTLQNTELATADEYSQVTATLYEYENTKP
jgi:hypothetical protein